MDRRRRRTEAKKKFRVLAGGLKEQPPPPGQAASSRDRLGQALRVLVEQFRREEHPVTRQEEVRILMELAVRYARTLPDNPADLDQFMSFAAFIFEEQDAMPPGAG